VKGTESGTGSDRPRVLHLTTAHQADDVRILERECKSLAELDLYDVTLAAPGHMPKVEGVAHIPLTETPSRRMLRFLAGHRRGTAISRALTVDIWHIHDPELLPTAISLAKRGECVIWDAHEDYWQLFSQPGAKDWVPPAAFRVVSRATGTLLRLADKNVSAVIAATPQIQRRYSNPRTVLVGNEARIEDFAGCVPTFESRRVLFTGPLNDGQSFWSVVEAVSAIPECVLLVAGYPPDPSAWLRVTQILGPRARHLGRLDRAGLREAISQSSLGFCTYADQIAHQTNRPNKLYEFAAAGLPVVATPTESNISLLTDSRAGLIASGFDFESIRLAVMEAWLNSKRWQEWSSNGIAWSKDQGSWTQSANRLVDLYSDLIAERAGS